MQHDKPQGAAVRAVGGAIVGALALLASTWPAQAEPEDAETGPWELRIVAEGEGVPGVIVRHTEEYKRGTTDVDGRVRLPWSASARSLKVALEGAGALTEATLDRRATTLDIGRVPGLRVLVLPTEPKGKPLPVERVFVHCGDLEIPLVETGSFTYELPRIAASPWYPPEWAVHIETGSGFADAVIVPGGLGMGLESGEHNLAPCFVSQYTTTLEVVAMIGPEAPIRLRALESNGMPLEGAEVEGVTLEGLLPPIANGPRLSFRAAPAGKDGVIEIRGLPFHEGETVVVVSSNGLKGDARRIRATTLALSRDRPTKPVDVRVTARPPTLQGGIGVGGSGGGRSRHDPYTPYAGPEKPATLALTVRRLDGTPAADALVTLRKPRTGKRTDAEGRVTFPGLPPGKVRFTLLEVGLVATLGSADLEAGTTAEVTLKENAGSDVRVHVIDKEGRPVPFATIRYGWLHGYPVARVTDGVQPLTLHANAKGVTTIEDIPPLVRWHVVATLGRRRGTAAFAEGQETPVTVTLSDPGPPEDD